jgi:hypothetical protein
MLQERDEILPETASAPIEVAFIRDPDAFELCLLVRVKGLEPGIDVTTAELLQHIGHFDCPNGLH